MQTIRSDRVRKIFDEIARGLNLDRTLGLIAEQIAAEMGSPTCKIWVVKRGDICDRCPLLSVCNNREMCMHLVATSGAAIEKEYPRIPLSIFNANMISYGAVSDFGDPAGPGDKLFGLQHGAAEETRDSYALSPLRGNSGILGLIGIFNHRPIEAGELHALAEFAPPAVAAIRVAELQSRCELLRAQYERQAARASAAERQAADREREMQVVIAQVNQQAAQLKAELQQERDSLLKGVEENWQRLERLEGENEALRRRSEELIGLQQESGRAYSEWAAEVEFERNRLLEENALLRDQGEAFDQSLAEQDKLKEEQAKSLADRNHEIQKLNKELSVTISELAAAESANSKLEERISLLEQTNAGLRDHSAAITESVDDLERSLRLAEDARARLEQARVGLVERVAELTAEVEQARAENNGISGENEQLVTEIERLQGDIEALRAGNAEITEEYARLRAAADRLGGLGERVAELQQENSALRQANAQFEGIVKQFEGLTSRLEENALRLRDRAEANERARTEIEQRARVLVEQNRRLQIEGNAKARFLASMSHELRTPMNAIIGFTSLLLEDSALQLSDRHRRNLERVSRNARDLLQLINNVLDLSKIDSGRMDVFSEAVDVRDVIDRALSVVESLKQGHAIEIRVEVQDQLPALRTDRTKLQQVLINLLSNAIKFTPQGEVKISAEAAGPGHVSISVSDTGVGIAESDMPKIFEEFLQVGRYPAAPAGSGTGLGLAITRRLVDLLEGEITVSSKIGEGSVFRVRLPREIEGRAAPASETEAARDHKGRTAVVFDSNPGSLFLTKKYLTEAGYSVAATDDPARALELIKSVRPAVISIDTDCQDEDRPSLEDLLRGVRAASTEQDGRSLVIAISSDSEGERLALAAGATCAIRKPIERAEMLRALGRAAAPVSHQVLVVDDDQDAIDLVTAMLEGGGYQIRTAMNGRRALEELESLRPDLIVLDLMLPEMDGFEVVHRLTLNPEWRTIPVILLTARDLSHEERRALDIGTVRVVQKGNFTRDELLAEIKSAISSSSNGATPSIGP